MYLFFDTETTGTPKNYKAPVTDLDNWPRVIQLAWQLVDKNGETIEERKYLVKPDDWEVPSVEYFVKQGFSEESAKNKARFWMEHGYTNEQNEKEGEPMHKLLDIFLGDYEKAEYLVAHNMEFDYRVLGSEMLRYGKRAKKKKERFCTMLATVNICKIPGNYGYKWPKLEELYTKVFGNNFEGAHDALNDVVACKECFFELKKRGYITI